MPVPAIVKAKFLNLEPGGEIGLHPLELDLQAGQLPLQRGQEEMAEGHLP
jgi:hypothetical protein